MPARLEKKSEAKDLCPLEPQDWSGRAEINSSLLVPGFFLEHFLLLPSFPSPFLAEEVLTQGHVTFFTVSLN